MKDPYNKWKVSAKMLASAYSYSIIIKAVAIRTGPYE